MKQNGKPESVLDFEKSFKVKILPKSQRAKNRVREHGEVMLLRRLHPNDRFLVESLGNTWNGTTWAGWFRFEEASYEEVL
jgi:hypothetical protein